MRRKANRVKGVCFHGGEERDASCDIDAKCGRRVSHSRESVWNRIRCAQLERVEWRHSDPRCHRSCRCASDRHSQADDQLYTALTQPARNSHANDHSMLLFLRFSFDAKWNGNLKQCNGNNGFVWFKVLKRNRSRVHQVTDQVTDHVKVPGNLAAVVLYFLFFYPSIDSHLKSYLDLELLYWKMVNFFC